MDICLELVSPKDYEQIILWYNNPKFEEFFRLWPDNVSYELLTYLNNGLMYKVYNNQQLSGLVTLQNNDVINKNIEFGIMLDCPNSHELCKKTIYKLLNYVFKHMKYKKAYCSILDYRDNLSKLLEKYNFHYDGVLRDNIILSDNKYYSEKIYSILDHEFDKLEKV